MTIEPPVRLCCFQRHWGVVCADQHFMCCMCFDRFPVAEAYNGEDVCQACGKAEATNREIRDRGGSP